MIQQILLSLMMVSSIWIIYVSGQKYDSVDQFIADTFVQTEKNFVQLRVTSSSEKNFTGDKGQEFSFIDSITSPVRFPDNPSTNGEDSVIQSIPDYSTVSKESIAQFINNTLSQSVDKLAPIQVNTALRLSKVRPPDAILFWNLVMLYACASDYNTVVTEKPDQPGPTTTSRAFAIIHGAMYDAAMIFNPDSKLTYFPLELLKYVDRSVTGPAYAAVMEAAYQTLRALYPKQRQIFNILRAYYYNKLSSLQPWYTTEIGIYFGKLVASSILKQRRNDGSKTLQMYMPKGIYGYHMEDPTNPGQGFHGVHWGGVKPFFLDSPSQYRPSNIVGETLESRDEFINNSSRYIDNFNEVLQIGSKTSTVRTSEQTEIGIFWGYDGAPNIGVPPRLYNQIVRIIAIKKQNTMFDNARLFALVNYALADAGVACWEAKYYYQLWRPVLGIRFGSNATTAHPNWTPLGAPADGAGINFTPPFPSYVSGHSTFGSACFETLRLFYKTDEMSFDFQSDEYNGKTVDSNTGMVRPAKTRHFNSFSQAETENFLSRIYLGVHWRIDQEDGLTLGRTVARHVFKKFG